MAISPTLLHTTAALFLLFSLTATSSNDEVVSELISLQSQSKTGVIHLNDHLVSLFLKSPTTKATPPRSFSLLVFFDAKQLHEKPELRLTELHREFALLASSFRTNHPNSSSPHYAKIFFCDIEFKESQNAFSLFGVNSLPHIRLVTPNDKSLKDSLQMDQGDFARLAESMSDFVESKVKIPIGPIHRPPFLSKTQIGLLVLGLLIWASFMVKKVLAGQTLLHDWKAWLLGAIFVYFFSVSGSMHNIIRSIPLFLVDRHDPNKLVFFYQGSGMQLGAEGIAVGFLYTVVGLLVALVSHVLIRVRNANFQRVGMVVAIVVSFCAVTEVVWLDNWKTGYGIHAFWPSSWS